jgi:hypothetical protein
MQVESLSTPFRGFGRHEINGFAILALTIAKVAGLIQEEMSQRADAHSQDMGDLAIVRAPVGVE